MSLAEIVHRVVETASKQTARWHSRGWNAVETSGPLAIIPDIAARITASFPDLAAVIGREAEDIRAGAFCLLGARWPKPASLPPEPTFWRIDPDDGEPFPKWDIYTFDLSFRHGINTREMKRVWELNRLQFLIPLAADALLNDRDESALLTGMIKSW
ncbi:MAG: hypothetical protein ACREDL_12935, partial [Bradyrhizobium sp.]